MRSGTFWLFSSFLILVLFGIIVYVYYCQETSATELTQNYDPYKLIDYLPKLPTLKLPQKNISGIQYFWQQLNLYLSDLRSEGKISDDEKALVLSNFYSGAIFISLLLDQEIIDWSVFLNCFFYKNDSPICIGIK